MAGIGDIQFFMKKQKECGDMSKCPRTKNYSKNVGGLLLSGMMAIAAWRLFSESAIDFFMKDLRTDKRPNNRPNDRK